ncbi:MAG: DUF3299 domain-containing protein [Gemmatimonadetes bacterium]|nr:DUF3299 domain-containing protein [Gemmatimonadota bacterium]
MTPRLSVLATSAALVGVVAVTTAFTPRPSPRPAPAPRILVPVAVPVAAPVTAPVASPAAPTEDAVNIDWRVLAGLDYTNGTATDTLKKLEGKLVRIPGFVVPLDDFQEEGAEFLLVPYYGACVHTPPPPPNQIVMVGMSGKKAIKLNLFDAVWMSGRLKISSVESPYGTVGYQLEGLKVEPYSSK